MKFKIPPTFVYGSTTMNRFVAILGSIKSHALAVCDFIEEEGLVADIFPSSEKLPFPLPHGENQWHHRGYTVVLIVDENYQLLWCWGWPSVDHVRSALQEYSPERRQPEGNLVFEDDLLDGK